MHTGSERNIKRAFMHTSTTAQTHYESLQAFWGTWGDVILNYGSVPVPLDSTGIGGNTYRALGAFTKSKRTKRGKTVKLVKPSKVVSDWAQNEFKTDFLELLDSGLKTNNIYDKFCAFHQKALQSLVRYWNGYHGTKSIKRAMYPYASKLLDLHIKHLLWHRAPFGNKHMLTRDLQKKLIEIAYQPLDKYSLEKLRLFDATGIPRGSMMGTVKSEEQYLELQERIRDICSKARVPCFAFDMWAWNSRSTKSSESEDEQT